MLFIALLLSLGADALFGEPPARLHPVVWMGRYLTWGRGVGSSLTRPLPLFLAGLVLVTLGAALSGGTAWVLGGWLAGLPWWLELPTLAFLLKPFFSVAALLQAGEAVRGALLGGNLLEARRLLGWHLVSRDTSLLSEAEVAGAAVESLAENLTDSVVAPLFYFALFGLPGAAVYRFVNTADATLGYRTPELEYLGKAAARLDDALNFVPARLSALLLYAALAVRGHRAGDGWRVMRRDARRTPSPNAGVTMALVAGGLGVRLDKRGVYALNEPGRAPRAEDVAEAGKLVQTAVGAYLPLHLLFTRLVALAVG